MNIERQCERLVLDFVHYNDTQNYEAMVDLFASDGVFTRPSGESLTGHAAILQVYKSRPGGRITRHICTNIRITVESPNRAHGLTYAIVFSAASGDSEGQFGLKADTRQLVGEFEDEFVKTEEGWKFAVRRARFVMHT